MVCAVDEDEVSKLDPTSSGLTSVEGEGPSMANVFALEFGMETGLTSVSSAGSVCPPEGDCCGGVDVATGLSTSPDEAGGEDGAETLLPPDGGTGSSVVARFPSASEVT